jgi:CheY-like chemotaxis protein
MKKLMKILFLNPKIDAEHKISKGLLAKGAALLFPADSTEAWQMLKLHGTSVDLAIIHREGIVSQQNEAGLQLISQIKSDPNQADLPIILTTDLWGDADCAKHQDGPEGVNAYIRSPFSENKLLDVIQAILGQPLSGSQSSPAPPNPIIHHQDPNGPILQDASDIFLRNESYDPSDTSIRLEAPEFSESSGSIPTAIHVPELNTQSQSIPTAVGKLEELSLVSDPSSNSVLEITSLPFTVEEVQDESQSAQIEPLIEPHLQSEGEDLEAVQEMPYLFGDSQKVQKSSINPSLLFAEPLGDAVVPGGAAQAPDLETFKKYLLLREQDVAVLSNQLKAAHDQMALTEKLLREERAKNVELNHTVQEQQQKIDEFDKEKAVLVEGQQSDINELHFQVKVKTDKARVLELQAKELSEEMAHLKERVRTDIRKIRIREKELENRLEIMKKDSEALIGARENKIIELKRKLDLLEFNMDLLQDQYAREKENSEQLRDRLSKAAQMVRVAGGLLDSTNKNEPKAS